jgi:hypothetical protein
MWSGKEPRSENRNLKQFRYTGSARANHVSRWALWTAIDSLYAHEPSLVGSRTALLAENSDVEWKAELRSGSI